MRMAPVRSGPLPCPAACTMGWPAKYPSPFILPAATTSSRRRVPARRCLVGAVTADSDVTWEMTTPSMWNRGDYIEDQAAGELVILATDHPSAGSDVTVRRGQRGTTAAASYATTDVFYKNPVYPRYRVERFIKETVDNDLWPYVWNIAETTVSFTAGDTTYEMPTDCFDVAQVYQYDLNSDGKLYPIDTKSWDYTPVVAAAASTNRNFLRLYRVRDPSATVYVTYKQKPLSTDLPSLSAPLASMVPWAVCGKLLAGTRIVPSRTEPGRATPVSNQSSSLRSDFGAFDVTFRRMRKDEANRLRKQAPVQKRFRSSIVRAG